MLPVISIVGRPNVGKSSLFNRILGRRVAVVDDIAGVTRDRNYMKAVWNDVEFTLVDTGGLIPNLHEAIPEAIHEQVDIAIRESAVILFVVELGTGVTDWDQIIARQLRKHFAERTILVVNKAESSRAAYEVPAYMQLGLGKPFAVSALHGKGVGDLLDETLYRAHDWLKARGEEVTKVARSEEDEEEGGRKRNRRRKDAYDPVVGRIPLGRGNAADKTSGGVINKSDNNTNDSINSNDDVDANASGKLDSKGTGEILQSHIEQSSALRVAVVGRPNAGKSSLVNKLLNQNRMIVDSKAGTTRDAIDSLFTHNGRDVIIIDTAGLRKKARVKKADLEYYSNLRALDSIDRCDVCVLVIDTGAGIGVQDMRILKKIQDSRKGVVLVWNKWDVVEKDHKTFDKMVAETREEYQDLKYVPMISLSALTGQRVSSLMDVVFAVKERMTKHVGGKEFEDMIFDLVRAKPHPVNPSKVVRFLGAKQVSASYPLFKFFVTNHEEVSPGYERFLVNTIYEKYDFLGCPVVAEFRPIGRGRFHDAEGGGGVV